MILNFKNINILVCLIFLVLGKFVENVLGQVIGIISILVEWNIVFVEFDIILFNVFYVKISKLNEIILRIDVNVIK